MTNNDDLALKLKKLATKAGGDEWEPRKIAGEFLVIRKGSYVSEPGYRTYQPVAEIDHKPTRDFVAASSPASILSLLAERDADKKRIAELEHQREEETQRANRADFEGYSRAMREMEARTVSVPTFEEWCKMEDMKPLGWVREAMKEAYDGCRAAAGIKLEVGE